MSLNKIAIFDNSQTTLRKSYDPIFLRFEGGYLGYHIVDSYGRNLHRDLLLSLDRMGKVLHECNRVVIYKNQSPYAMISMDGSDAGKALVADLYVRIRGPFEELTMYVVLRFVGWKYPRLTKV